MQHDSLGGLLEEERDGAEKGIETGDRKRGTEGAETSPGDKSGGSGTGRGDRRWARSTL